MSDKFGRVKGTKSSEMIREAISNYMKLPKEVRIDLMVQSKSLTPEQGERAKQRWAEIQAEKARRNTEQE